MNPHYPTVARRAGHRCEYCRAPEAVFNFPLEVEHILSTSRGSTDEEANLCLACRACNVWKGDRIVAFDELSVLGRFSLGNPKARGASISSRG
jgi:5-methylcytosine-specific restriction endonuclease McrA